MSAGLEHAAAELLRRLIRHNTVNPPGAERPLQEELAAELQKAGLEVQLLGRTDERPNLVARLRGNADGPTLCLLSHVDTVLADPAEWSRDPWSGDLVDGDVWGRGAQDMKSQTAAEAAAVLDLALSGWRPARGDLLLVACADEETGGSEGAQWLCATHPDAVRCDYLINEGAGTVLPFEGRPLYGVCTAEKGVFRFTITTHGTAGHASMPNIADNALLKLAPLVERLGGATPGIDMTEAPRVLFDALGVDGDDPLGALRERDPVIAAFVEPMLSVTFAPTRVAASEKINVIPHRATMKVDCRVPPGLGEDVARRRIEEALGSDGYELQFDECVVGNSSPASSPLMDAIKGWVEREYPEAGVVPIMLPAFTDSRTFREAFPDVVAYGFFPQTDRTLYEAWPMVHGKDERISAADVGRAALCYRDLAKELLGD